MPILKQLVSGSSQAKRRSRADLTAEMISAPLGDFRHTMHVGRGGDAFGDTSFLSSRSGEPPRSPEQPPPAAASPGPKPKPGLLSRTFRSSKRSQSVTRADGKRDDLLAPPAGSAAFVKNAVSLPHLNDEEDLQRGVARVPKSLSSSPLRKGCEPDPGKPANGATAGALELDERDFGELTDLPPSAGPRGAGMKHAESIMSFHIDLGPSMLGDILSVMEKKGWEEDDLGFEEGKISDGRASPPLSPAAEEEDDEEEEEEEEEERRPHAPARPPRASSLEDGPYTPEVRPRRHAHQHLDSCSVSSSGSAALEEKPSGPPPGGDSDSATFSSPRGEDDKDFSFMDEEEDEIRV
ncbi:cdc42 effector protein 4 [Conger conger]|uniref:cdc42 effector protein 4 n=1 Tax=Conger conger TaxID=82655 RepID=UPI002A599512|nr:cdc42 effector protein 4 [Conger conger]